MTTKAVEPLGESKDEWEFHCLLLKALQEQAAARGQPRPSHLHQNEAAAATATAAPDSVASGSTFDSSPSSPSGLANVKRIVERHGGTIEGCARVGQGAEFRFSFGIAVQP